MHSAPISTPNPSPTPPRDTVWIPAVPLPFLGWRTDRCVCGKKFRGKGRKAAYELHYRRVHEREHESVALMEVERVEAKRIYDLVNADSDSPPEVAR